MSRRAQISAFLLCLFSTSYLWAAAFKITGISGASNYTINSDGTAKIFGGLGGTCASPDPASTCNTCTSAISNCNPKRVHDSLVLRINFTVTEDLNAPIWLGYENSGSISEFLSYTKGTTSNLMKNVSSYVDVTWGTLCTANGWASCNVTTANSSFKIVLGAATSGNTPSGNARFDINTPIVHPADPASGTGNIDLSTCDNTSPAAGVCYFRAAPGDEKIYVKDVDSFGTYPSSNGVRLIALRIFFSDVNFDDANYTSPNYVDLTIPDDNVGEPTPDRVDGLENGVTYFFRPAVVDEALNVFGLVDLNEIDSFGGCSNPGAISDDAACDMMATPDKVFGLLTEDLNCFISTAAYGSSMAVEVQTFREFRNRFLVPSDLGRKLIKAYYNFGPKAARFIHENPSLKPIARGLLYPALWYTELSLKFRSPWIILTVFLLAFTVGVFGVSRWRILKR